MGTAVKNISEMKTLQVTDNLLKELKTVFNAQCTLCVTVCVHLVKTDMKATQYLEIVRQNHTIEKSLNYKWQSNSEVYSKYFLSTVLRKIPSLRTWKPC